jgi:hypothetical protein
MARRSGAARLAAPIVRGLRRLFASIGALARPQIFALCLVLVALVGIADYWAKLELSLDLFYLVPVSVAAWFLGSRIAMAFSALGAGIWFAADYLTTPSYSHPLIPYWNAAVILGFLLLTVAALTAIRTRVERELELASEIQARLVPARPPRLDGLDLAWEWRPAESVGGDYFDVLPFDDGRLGLCIADAIGHGIPAALLMANLRSAVRTLALPDRRPAELCARLNSHLAGHLPTGKFFTLWYGMLASHGHTLQYSNAGHNPALLIAPDGAVTRLGRGGPLLGIRAGAGYESEEVAIEPASRLVLFTDGLVEARDREDREFGYDRLIDVLVRDRAFAAGDLVASIERELRAFTERPLDDDLTILVVAVAAA